MKSQPAKKKMPPQVLKNVAKPAKSVAPNKVKPKKPYTPGSIKRGYTRYA